MIAGSPSILDVAFDSIAAMVRKLTKLLRRRPAPKPKRKESKRLSSKPRKALGPNRARTAKFLPFKRAANQWNLPPATGPFGRHSANPVYVLTRSFYSPITISSLFNEGSAPMLRPSQHRHTRETIRHR